MMRGRKPGYFKLYSVWSNRDDSLIAFEQTAEKCAELMGVTIHSFYSIISRQNGDSQKWHIESRWMDDDSD